MEHQATHINKIQRKIPSKWIIGQIISEIKRRFKLVCYISEILSIVFFKDGKYSSKYEVLMDLGDSNQQILDGLWGLIQIFRKLHVKNLLDKSDSLGIVIPSLHVDIL